MPGEQPKETAKRQKKKKKKERNMYNWVTLLYRRNGQNTVNQL